MNVRAIATTTHGRYLVESPPGDAPAPLLVGFHGQAEDAEAQLARMNAIPGAERWIRCSVQGLNRWYRGRGGAQAVVAGWMTRQDRELAIADNRTYVASVVAEVKRDHAVTGAPVYAGFSQGVAMAFRAVTLPGHGCSGVIAMAADVPPELRTALAGFPPVLIGRGTRDAWYDGAHMDGDVRLLRAAGVAVTTCVFDGGHEWTAAFARAAGAFLAALSAGAPC